MRSTLIVPRLIKLTRHFVALLNQASVFFSSTFKLIDLCPTLALSFDDNFALELLTSLGIESKTSTEAVAVDYVVTNRGVEPAIGVSIGDVAMEFERKRVQLVLGQEQRLDQVRLDAQTVLKQHGRLDSGHVVECTHYSDVNECHTREAERIVSIGRLRQRHVGLVQGEQIGEGERGGAHVPSICERIDEPHLHVVERARTGA